MRALTTTAGLVLLLWQVAFADVINGFDLSDTLIPRAEIAHGGPPRDGIPALTDPRFESAVAVSGMRETSACWVWSGTASPRPIRCRS